MHDLGDKYHSDASKFIEKLLTDKSNDPIWFQIWGGPRPLSQALWSLEKKVSKPEFDRIKKKVRIYDIYGQDNTAKWIRDKHSDILYLHSYQSFRGIYQGGNSKLVSRTWIDKNIKNHGEISKGYPWGAALKDGVKEGDTPCFLYIMPNGLNSPENPDWESWGGRFQKRKNAVWASNDKNSIAKWREAFQNEFAARLDWCIKDPKDANHSPKAIVSKQSGVLPVYLKGQSGQKVDLDASMSQDRDGDKLSYLWEILPRSTQKSAKLENANKEKASITIPDTFRAKDTLHLLLTVKDDGQPSLSSYRRVILVSKPTTSLKIRKTASRKETLGWGKVYFKNGYIWSLKGARNLN